MVLSRRAGRLFAIGARCSWLPAGIVPDLWQLEAANTLLVGERRKRSTQANTVTWLGFLASLPIAVDEETKLHVFGSTESDDVMV